MSMGWGGMARAWAPHVVRRTGTEACVKRSNSLFWLRHGTTTTTTTTTNNNNNNFAVVTDNSGSHFFQAFDKRSKSTSAAVTRLLSTKSNRNEDDDGEEWKVPISLTIPEEYLDMSFVRSGGAGGQNVNKLSTQVQLKLPLDAQAVRLWLPDEVLQRLMKQQANRINKVNELVIQMQEHRSQLQNRKAAVDKLRDMILQAWRRPKQRKLRTGVSKETKERYKKEKMMQSDKKQNRQRMDTW